MKRPGLTFVVVPATLFVFTALHAADGGTATSAPAVTSSSASTAAPSVHRAPESRPPLRALTAQQILERFDKNGDGKLDDEERAAAHEAMMNAHDERRAQRKDARQGRPGMAMRDELLRRFDANGDGKIDDTEWAALEPLLRRRIEDAPLQLRRWDKNGDGKIDDAEWAAASEQIRRFLNAPATGEPTAKRSGGKKNK